MTHDCREERFELAGVPETTPLRRARILEEMLMSNSGPKTHTLQCLKTNGVNVTRFRDNDTVVLPFLIHLEPCQNMSTVKMRVGS